MLRPDRVISTPLENLLDYTKLYDEVYFQDYRADVNSVRYKKRVAMYQQEYRRITNYVQAGNVLDVGCGLGDFLQSFDSTHWRRYGIEVAPYAIETAKQRGIQMELPSDPEDFFDLVVFRGTIQVLDEPLTTLKKCIRWLRPGGFIVFLATPNIGSIFYRLFQELPTHDPTEFLLVSEQILRRILESFGMEVLCFEFPYIGTPYAHPLRDLYHFALRCVGIRRPFAFWGNMLECYARKPLAVPW